MAKQPYRMAKNLEDAVEALRVAREAEAQTKAELVAAEKAVVTTKAAHTLAGTTMDDARRAVDSLVSLVTDPAAK